MLHYLHVRLTYNHYVIARAYNAAYAHTQGIDQACWNQKNYSLVEGNRTIADIDVICQIIDSSLYCSFNLCRGQLNEPASTQSTFGRDKKLKRRHWLINIKTQDNKDDEIEDDGNKEDSNHGDRQQITSKASDQKEELVSQASTSKTVSYTLCIFCSYIFLVETVFLFLYMNNKF